VVVEFREQSAGGDHPERLFYDRRHLVPVDAPRRRWAQDHSKPVREDTAAGRLRSEEALGIGLERVLVAAMAGGVAGQLGVRQVGELGRPGV
jgi:hypothetical protein